jgi:hypothetical protein
VGERNGGRRGHGSAAWSARVAAAGMVFRVLEAISFVGGRAGLIPCKRSGREDLLGYLSPPNAFPYIEDI